MLKKYHVSKNLAPPMSNGWVDGYVNASTGEINQPTSANEKTSDYIDVHQYSYVSNCYENGDFPSRGASTSTTAWYGLGCYREDKSFISRLINNLTYQLPAGTYYVRMCFRTFGETGNVMVNGGDSQLPYEPYSSEVWHEIPYYLHETSTDTLTTLPADIYANATTATVGLKGQTTQSGTPTPQNPVMPEGCGNMTGNLLFVPTTGATVAPFIVSYTSNSSEFTINKDVTSNNVSTNVLCNIVLNAGTYTIKIQGLNSVGVNLVDSNNVIIVQNIVNNTSVQFTVTETTTIAKIAFVAAASSVYNNQVVSIMLNEGSTALPYEPYGVKIPISSANTTTPVYLGEVQSTRKIKKLVLTGNETGWTKNDSIAQSNAYYRSISGYYRYNGLCSHYATVDDVRAETGVFFGGNINFLTTLSDEIDTVDKWKTYLQQQYAAGTPVTVWYVLATPQTAVVNEPLMRIGDHADEVSNITIPVTAGGDTISVGTTVQPSEITVNYKGWHPKTPKESNNGQWS